MFPYFAVSDVFLDSFGVLEGESLVRDSSTRYNLRYSERPVVHHNFESRSRLNHSCLQPIITTPSADPSLHGAFEDWTVLSRPGSHSIDIHVYGLRGSHGPTSILVCLRTSGFSDVACEPLHRTHLHHLQFPSDLRIGYYTNHGPSICLMTTYSWVYSSTTDWPT